MQIDPLMLLLKPSCLLSLCTHCTRGVTLEHGNTLLWDSIQVQIPTHAYAHTYLFNLHVWPVDCLCGEFPKLCTSILNGLFLHT